MALSGYFIVLLTVTLLLDHDFVLLTMTSLTYQLSFHCLISYEFIFM